MSLHPIKATQAIRKSYIDYLSTTFRLKDGDLQRQFKEILETQDKFVKGPILEATPPFETGSSIEELILDGVLSSQFRELKSERMPSGPLYQHQEMAIRKIVLHHRNLVVATGTGSGKTEAFLIPILDHLFQQKQINRLSPGVRALLLYPMNALANDQMMRMHELLKHYPHITFGRYTGETEERNEAAESKYRKMFKRAPLENELISRDQMRSNPPHILLTNYAMLEYLLLRPDDHVFFDGKDAQDWRFIVIDEAHTYTGAKGIEMAMLLRRLKDRIVESKPGRLRCIATSATIGGGRKDSPRIALFAQRLFGEKFEWIEDDAKRQDVIEAVRKPVMRLGKEAWGKPHESLYSNLLDVINSNQTSEVTSRIRQIAIEKGVPETVLANAQSEIAQGDYRQLLFKILRGDKRVTALQGLLEAKPQYLHDIAQQIFGDTSDAEENLAALVNISIHAKPGSDDQSLIPARYHLFVRAIEGAYLTLGPQKRLYLERRENIDGYKVFEIAVCRQCGSTYLVGETRRDNNNSKLFKQPGKQYFENSGNLEFLLLEYTGISEIPIDEDEVVSSGDGADFASDEDRYILCASCGAIDRHNLIGKMCGCEDSNQYFVRKVKSGDGNVYRCPACGKQSPSGLVWRFLTGDDATASVLAEALYQQLPPRNRDNSDAKLEYEIPHEDEWSIAPPLPSSSEMDASIQMGKRQLLIFSDSRQSAAFFAPYLNRTHSQILQRRLIMETIDTYKQDVLQNQWRVRDLVNSLQQTINRFGIFPEKSPQEVKNEAWKWVFYELIALDRRNSLEGLGCLGFALAKPPNWQPPRRLMSDPWNLSADEVWTLFQILLDSIRTKGAMLFPDNIAPDDDFFKPRKGEYYFRENASYQKKHIYSWCPDRKNARLDFLTRLVQRAIGTEISEEACREVLTKIWRFALFPTNQASYWQNYFSSHNMKGEGTVYRMKYDFWELRPSTIDNNIQWYQCDRCNNLTLFNIRGICPTYRCDGNLTECCPEDVLHNNHYRNLYLGVEPIGMRVEEHTAQLTGEAAADLQTQFVQGNVNVLSCSTTFELGVDVGELESVFMRNVPPSSANYVQRAGRAGRRIDSAAFALTFAQRRPHDLSFFNDPEQMVSGVIRAPHFEIENEKIIRRHVYATAIASFWKSHRGMFKNVDCFFFADGEGGPELLAEYLNSRPDDLKQALYRIVPESFHSSLGISDWEWVSGLSDKHEGVLSRCSDEVRSDVQELEKVRRELTRESKPSDYLLRTINTIKGRYLINFLSSRNVIPKYGFPVDVVELRIPHHSDDAKRLELDRDLRIALSEYAPSSQVVAGGKLWTSRYLKRLPNREWPKYRYAVCDHCQCYQSIRAESSQKPNLCKACGNSLTGKNQGTFVIPEFGFIVNTGEPQKPGEERPQRTYTTRTYYSETGEAKEGQEVRLTLGDTTLLAIPASDGQMAVINHAGYQGFGICPRCGYAILGNESLPEKHETPWRSECRGRFSRLSLGHEFKTDILQLRFEGYHCSDNGFWLSLLYALLEGASESLDIDRQDLDGCLYPFAGDPAMPALIMFDDVPGGAGHVRRIGESKETLRDILVVALQRLKNCDCGGGEGNTSCYGCLRNYRNQFCHDQLNRGIVINFLEDLSA